MFRPLTIELTQPLQLPLANEEPEELESDALVRSMFQRDGFSSPGSEAELVTELPGTRREAA